MKKLFLLLLTVSLMGCSSEDIEKEPETDPIVITNDDWEKTDWQVIGGVDYWHMRIMATVKNEGEEDKTGIVRFVVKSGGPYLNSDEFTIDPGSTIEVDKVTMKLFTQEEINKGYDLVEFLER